MQSACNTLVETYRGRGHAPVFRRLGCALVLLHTPVQQLLAGGLLHVQDIQRLLELFGRILKEMIIYISNTLSSQKCNSFFLWEKSFMTYMTPRGQILTRSIQLCGKEAKFELIGKTKRIA